MLTCARSDVAPPKGRLMCGFDLIRSAKFARRGEDVHQWIPSGVFTAPKQRGRTTIHDVSLWPLTAALCLFVRLHVAAGDGRVALLNENTNYKVVCKIERPKLFADYEEWIYGNGNCRDSDLFGIRVFRCALIRNPGHRVHRTSEGQRFAQKACCTITTAVPVITTAVPAIATPGQTVTGAGSAFTRAEPVAGG